MPSVVEQRAAAVARVDRGVGLDQAGADLAVDGDAAVQAADVALGERDRIADRGSRWPRRDLRRAGVVGRKLKWKPVSGCAGAHQRQVMGAVDPMTVPVVRWVPAMRLTTTDLVDDVVHRRDERGREEESGADARGVAAGRLDAYDPVCRRAYSPAKSTGDGVADSLDRGRWGGRDNGGGRVLRLVGWVLMCAHDRDHAPCCAQHDDRYQNETEHAARIARRRYWGRRCARRDRRIPPRRRWRRQRPAAGNSGRPGLKKPSIANKTSWSPTDAIRELALLLSALRVVMGRQDP